MYRRTLVAVLACAAFSIGAQAQESKYPNRPIKLIVGYTPGGSNDVVARIVAKRLQESLGQPVLVENRPSTGAIVGAVVAAKAPPDGYTLMVGASGPIVINPATYQSLPYSPQKDFTPISLMATFPLIVSVKADSRIGSMADLVKYTKDNPQASNYSSSASTFQLATELLKERTGILAENVPYKGSAESMQAVAGGQVTFSMLDPGPASGAIKGNLLRGLAVTSAKPMASYPNVPTLKAQGIDLEINFWIGLFAPAGTPAPIIELLQRETAQAVANSETVKTMDLMGLTPASSSSKAFAEQIAQETQSWTTLARQKNIKSD